jgi:8-oxo-dGTP pyrophosphatase MutT (NUDIX family)
LSGGAQKNLGAFCYLVRGSSILLVRRNYGDRFWTLPGGAIELLEDPEEGMKREVFEETGFEIQSPAFVCSFFSRSNYSVAFCFLEEVTGELPLFEPGGIWTNFRPNSLVDKSPG